MNIYSLKPKQYKELKQNFKETVIGYRLTILFEICIGLFIFGAIFDLFNIILDGITGGQYSLLNSNFSSTFLYVTAICSFLSYNLYFQHLKNFYDESKK